MFLKDSIINQDALNHIKTNIQKYSPKPHKVKIMAVTKTLSAKSINSAINAGINIIGENKIQETKLKEQNIKKTKKTEIHFIGQLQSNKIKEAVKMYDVIHTICREKTLQKINKEAEKQNKTQKILIQLNISNNTKQNGLESLKAEEFCKKTHKYKNTKLIGLMAIATNTKKATTLNGDFQALYNVFEFLNQTPKTNLTEISSGMSNDYIYALKNGSTIIRIGTELFGARK